MSAVSPQRVRQLSFWIYRSGKGTIEMLILQSKREPCAEAVTPIKSVYDPKVSHCLEAIGLVGKGLGEILTAMKTHFYTQTGRNPDGSPRMRLLVLLEMKVGLNTGQPFRVVAGARRNGSLPLKERE